MYCVVKYFVLLEYSNFSVILMFVVVYFEVVIGFFDYSEYLIEVLCVVVWFGVRLIEKYFMIDKNLLGVDYLFVLNLDELKEMVESIRKIEVEMK